MPPHSGAFSSRVLARTVGRHTLLDCCRAAHPARIHVLPMAAASAASPSSVPVGVFLPRAIHTTGRVRIGSSSKGLDDIPWFMEEDASEENEQPAVPEPEIPPPSILSGLGKGQDEVAQFLLPSQLEDLYDVLLAGPGSHLVAPLFDPPPAAASGSSEGRVFSMNDSLVPTDGPRKQGRPPIRFIHTPSLAPDQDTADWIIVVEARSANRGSVKRLAEEIGFYLEQTAPPSLALESTAEYLESFDLTEAEKEEIPTGGIVVVTRAVQDGIRMLHSSDPQLYPAEDLARAFRVPKRMIDRLLELDISLPDHQKRRRQRRVEQYQHLRTAAMHQEDRTLMQRVHDAFLRQRDQVKPNWEQEEPQASLQGYDPQDDTLPVKVLSSSLPYTLTDRDSGRELAAPTKSQKPVHNVSYEGLVPLTEGTKVQQNNPGTNRYINFRGPRVAARVDNRRKRGDGNWAMVDAVWCQVHVVTSKARKHYAFERSWEEATEQAAYEQVHGQSWIRDMPADFEWQVARPEKKRRPPPMRAPDPSDEAYDQWA